MRRIALGFSAVLALVVLARCADDKSHKGSNSPMAQAISHSQYDKGEELNRLLDSGYSAETVIWPAEDGGYETRALKYAVDHLSAVAIRALLAHGARPRPSEGHGESTLARVTNLDLDLARQMVEAGMNPNDGEGKGDTALHQLASGSPFTEIGGYGTREEVDRMMGKQREARARKRIEFAEWLISKGAHIDARGDNLQTPLCRAAQFNEDTSFLEFLIKKGADVNAKDYSPGAPLRAAALALNRPAVIILKKAGAKEQPVAAQQKRLVNRVGDIAALLKRYGAEDAK